MHKHRHYLIPMLFLVTFAAVAEPFLLEQELTGSAPVTQTDTFKVNAPPGSRVGVVFGANVLRGSFSMIPVGAPAQPELPQAQVENVDPKRPWKTSGATAIDVPAEGLTYEVARKDFVGEWSLSVATVPDRAVLTGIMPAGGLMMLIALAFLFYWHFKARPGWRWFALGALLWFVGVAAKLAVAVLLNEHILNALILYTPLWCYLVAGSLYIGLLTGVFEIGPVWLVAKLRPAASLTAARAIAVGVGAGTCEAFLLGVASAGQGIALTLLPVPEQTLVGMGSMLDATPLVMLVSPTERILAILSHIGSRTVLLYGIATRRGIHAWLGFWLLTLLDAFAGYAYLSGYIGGHNLWWVEASLVPFALAGAWLTVYCARHWPAVAADTPPTEPQEIADIEAGAQGTM